MIPLCCFAIKWERNGGVCLVVQEVKEVAYAMPRQFNPSSFLNTMTVKIRGLDKQHYPTIDRELGSSV